MENANAQSLAWDAGFQFGQREASLPTVDEILQRCGQSKRRAFLFIAGFNAAKGRPFPPHFRETAIFKLRETDDPLDACAAFIDREGKSAVCQMVDRIDLELLCKCHTWTGFLRRHGTRINGLE